MKKEEYQGQKTKLSSTPVIYRKWYELWKPKYWNGETIHKVYYEKAFDSNGVGLLCGDKVKVVKTGEIKEILEIFQGDLRFNTGYCWPNKVIKI